jgi:WXXGXW repeat (2 copies)
MPIRLIRGVFVAAMLSTVLSAIPASASTRVYVRIGPPVPIVEVRPVAPGPRYVWVDGYHRWDGRAYAWVPGRWVLPPRAHAVWVPGRWVHEKRGYYWVDGHWRH